MTETKIKINSWHDLRKEVKNIPIEEIAALREGELSLEKRGHQNFGLCPFHNDQNVGNFVIGGRYNGYKCFSCDATGDSISLIMKLDNIGFREALTKIAVSVGIMTDSELQDFLEDGKSINATRIDWGLDTSYSGFQEMTDEDRKNRHAVYSLLSEGRAIINPIHEELGVEKEERLNNKHYYHLTHDRGLTDKQIEDAGFFSLDDEFNFIGPLFYRLVNKLNLMPNTLNVPGFWRSNDDVSIPAINKSDGSVLDIDEENKQYFWKFDARNALGIPIKDEYGNIVAIQLRQDDQHPGMAKYTWFSSSYVNNQKDKTGGLSPGAQMDVMYPENWNTPHLFITEGKFKSISINKHLRSASISLQGINTYRGIGEVIDNINASHTKDIENIFIAFDGDMSFNDSVLNAVLKMSESELSGYNIHVSVWDHLFGKGIDDLINNGNSRALGRITLDELKEISSHVMEVNSTSNNKDIDSIKREKENVFYGWLKNNRPDIKLHSSRKQ